ncbi:hypothetical protein GGI20_001136 [Coemansia sp. BCRC 34301]|nr:hypothetical protein GGI20_001136 [Coemansia sp. BCRC 34301]
MGHPTHHLAKELVINVDELAVYSGEALEALSCAAFNGCAFPRARTLYVSFVSDRFDKLDAAHLPIYANIKAFTKRIQDMAPMIEKILVFSSVFEQSPRISPHFGLLASRLFQIASQIEYIQSVFADISVCLQLEPLRSLTYIDYLVEGYSCQSIQLARLNASTLQLLHIYSQFVADFAGLIRNPDDSYVTYPSLHTLSLRDHTDEVIAEELVFDGAIPFPSLRRLYLDSCYPFGDDVVFRGNAATLERLNVELGDLLVSIITEHNIFTPTSHPSLQRVKTWYPFDAMPLAFNTTAESLRFMPNIGLGAPVRSIEGAKSSADLVPALTSSYNYACIQILILPYFCSELWDIIALIKELPLLSDLHTDGVVFGSLPIGVIKHELPAYVISAYAPMAKRLRCWYFGYEWNDNYLEIAESVFLLALACPNLTSIYGAKYVKAKCIQEMEAAIESDMFKSYAPRFQCFLS